ncbi:MAG TPA: DUF3617 family protein [Allosphingosinicella sp.]|nr:DUF3617 family protein [Allosphingosinicella sp.]
MRFTPLPWAFLLILAAAPGLAADTLRPDQLRSAMGLKLGAWHSTFTVSELEIGPTPGADPAESRRAEAALRPKVGESKSFDECLWNSPELMFIPGMRVAGGCDFSRVEARGGRFAVTGICSRPRAGVRVETLVEGSYTPAAMTSRFEIVTTTGQMRIRMKADAQSRFAGPCPLPPVIMAPPPPKG